MVTEGKKNKDRAKNSKLHNLFAPKIIYIRSKFFKFVAKISFNYS